MRNSLNKKGFSLVELMIVVVIMGILVAVAIPLYDAITDNAKAKTCGSNQRIIRGAFSNWVLSDANNNADGVFKTDVKSFNSSTQKAEDVFVQAFLDQFEKGEIPSCSIEEHYFVIEKVDNLSVDVKCYAEDGTEATKHNAKGK